MTSPDRHTHTTHTLPFWKVHRVQRRAVIKLSPVGKKPGNPLLNPTQLEQEADLCSVNLNHLSSQCWNFRRRSSQLLQNTASAQTGSADMTHNWN